MAIARKGATTSPRVLPLNAADQGGGVEQDFYLAISKKEPIARWFLSTRISQSDAGIDARPIGTAVVSFKIQNGKIFMFRR
ncbi:MAG TPA: hypothetical protein VGG33_06665 [Polyangia bacterium]